MDDGFRGIGFNSCWYGSMDDGYVRDLGFIGALEFFSNIGLEFVY